MTAIKTAASAFALALPLAAGMALAGAAHAAGFYLQDLSAKQAGNAYSGAATAQGADALWWNPAAIAGTTTRELSFGTAYINPKGSVNDTGSVIVRPGQAPAGMGAREVTLIALLSPVTGVTTATALALLTRVLHTGGDLLLAAGSWALVRVPTRRGTVVTDPTVGGPCERS